MSTQTQDVFTQSKAEEFHRQGFIKLSGLFSHDEVMEWGKECDRLQELEIINPSNFRAHFKNPQLAYPEIIDPVVDISPIFRHLSEDERITSVLHEIFLDAPILLRDKLIYHLPGIAYSEIHQDWALGLQQLASSEDLISIAFQIDAADSNNGCIELFENYHQQLLTPPDKERTLNEEEKNLLDSSRHQTIKTNAGDVLILHSLTPHRSGRNLTTYPRRTLYLTYNAGSCGHLRDDYYQHYIHNVVGNRVDDAAFI